jgi:hypothetical protein
LLIKYFMSRKKKLFAPATTDTTNKDKLVIGVVINNEAKAYPIELIGYHHQVIDSMQQNLSWLLIVLFAAVAAYSVRM